MSEEAPAEQPESTVSSPAQRKTQQGRDRVYVCGVQRIENAIPQLVP